MYLQKTRIYFATRPQKSRFLFADVYMHYIKAIGQRNRRN